MLNDDQGSARRTGGRSARVRAAVLDATIESLLAHGIDGLTVGDVAERAHVHETSIYRRWGTRAQLTVDAVLSCTNAELPDPDTGSARGDLVMMLQGIVAFASTPVGRLLIQLASRQEMPEYDIAQKKFKTARFRTGMAILERAESRGELRPGIDHEVALETLIGPLHLRLLLTRNPLTQDFIEAVVDLVLCGITVGKEGVGR
jgi:AcrR family transcriptional regulator